ncbi:MAG: hypothetical protein Q8T11_11300 [Elusimicrobiota bacterium]|nr:hypothetical protein [Elusimicrobiota bacterium]
MISESRYWDAFREIRTVQGQAEEEDEDMLRQVAVPSADLAAMFDRLSMDLAFREISHGTSVTTKQRWLWRFSEWFTMLTSWTGVIAQILLIGVYCGRFSGKRLLPSGGGLSASA